MRTAITVRVDAALLIEARRCAAIENRTLTNLIETILRRRVAELASGAPPDGTGAQMLSKEGGGIQA